MNEEILNNIKVVKLLGSGKGKTLVILSAIHGNEVCGIKAFDKLIPKLKIKAGVVYFIYANLEAIKRNRRFVEYNLNRAFLKELPDSIKDTLEGRTAREIMPYLERADMMLDIHASNSKESIPFIICGQQSLELAQALPAQVIAYNFDEFEPGSTDYFMNIQNKIGVGVECGFLEDPESQRRAEEAIFSFLRFAGAINGEAKTYSDKTFYKIVKLYKNKLFSFKKSRDFSDFELLKKKTLIGKEGEKEIYAGQGEIVLFVRDRENIDGECFLVAKEVTREVLKQTVKYASGNTVQGSKK
ncbi:hypothetical protein FJZ18_02660 [Candidatus Pacearchaeota archaeon]|nr:hypothetical protein [Candidatus Pacearchaeota archaeon]